MAVKKGDWWKGERIAVIGDVFIVTESYNRVSCRYELHFYYKDTGEYKFARML